MSFDALAASRRAWIDDVLRPWCREARRTDLLKAEQEWNDIAGKVDADRTLWLWAWSRFPCLYVDGLGGLEESWEVRVTLRAELTSPRADGSEAVLKDEYVLTK